MMTPALYEIDPDTGEATGTVLPFHSAPCLDSWYLRIRDPQSADIDLVEALRQFEVGEADTCDFPPDLKCHGCGIFYPGISA